MPTEYKYTVCLHAYTSVEYKPQYTSLVSEFIICILTFRICLASDPEFLAPPKKICFSESEH